MRRNQTLHEALIPLLVEGIGADSYLEFGTHHNETISKVHCRRKFGVDLEPLIWETKTQYYRMTTEKFIREYAENLSPFDFVFIDADHSKEAVRADFEGIWPYVSDEGIVCLHDTNPETKADTEPGFCGDAWRLAMALGHEYEHVTLPYHPGLTIIRKRVHWGPK